MTARRFDVDLCVIGGGSGGVRAARMAAQRGLRVALVESSGIAGLGGTCVNLGCIPKKLYSYAAHYADAFHEAHGYGWEGPAPTLNWETLKTNRRTEITRLNGVYQRLLENAGVRLHHGNARLRDAHCVEIAPADGSAPQTLCTGHILIAVGGWPQVPVFPGCEHVITSNEIFDLTPFPQRLLIVGGGYIACEFASIFTGLGSRVTQLYRGAQILRGFDDDIRHFAAGELRKTGVDLRTESNLTRIEKRTDGLHVTLADGSTLSTDVVLCATGRTPRTQGLGLTETGVACAADGAIIVDAHYVTSVPSVLAVGDVINRVPLTPVALGEAMVVVDHLAPPPDGKTPRQMDYTLIPTAVFTQPGIGTVGLTEAQARAQFARVSIYKSEFRALRHTLSGSTERTLMKLVVDATSDRVVGLHMVGADAGEIVQGFAVAMKAGATKAVFDATLGIHPTAAEEFVTMREPSA